MADQTRARGQIDTAAPRPPPPGAKKGSDPWQWDLLGRAFTIALSVALFLHVLFLALPLVDALRLALLGSPDDYDDPDAQAIIPIDLDLLNEAPNPEATGTPATAPSDTPAPTAKNPGGEGIADAGKPDDTDAGPRDAGKPDAAPPVASASAVADAGPPPVRDPIAAAGGAGKLAAKDPNVQVYIASNVIRKHELGAAFGRLLVLIPEWHQFFQGSPIDPIRDLNHLLITAPRFLGDSSKMVAVMDYNVPDPQIRAAVDAMIQNLHGEWLDDTPVPTAQAKVLNSDRLFALVPSKKLFVVLPVDAKDQLAGLKQTKGFRNGTVGIVISMLTPARPFKRIFPVPDTLKWLRVAVTPTADGGADVAIEAGDKSPEDAAQHAPQLTQAFDGVRTLDMLLAKIDVIDHTEFIAVGDTIRAQVHVNTRQIKLIMGFVEKTLQDQAAKRAAAASSASAKAPAPLPASASPRLAPTAKAPPAPSTAVTGVASAAPKASD